MTEQFRITKEDIRRYKAVLKAAIRNQPLIRRREYLEASFVKPDLFNLVIEMGPNCNLRCPICLSDCGPDKQGLPNPRIVKRALCQAGINGIDNVQLTDGEPIREENREVLGIVLGYSSKIDLAILTNGTFASSFDDACRWFEFMKKKGLGLSSKKNKLIVSFGKPYSVQPENYFNINLAFKKVFPDLAPGFFLEYRLINLGDGRDNIHRHNQIIENLYEVFGERRGLYITHDKGEFHIRVYTDKGPPIHFKQQDFRPIGRGRNMSIADHLYPYKELTPQNLVLEQCAGDSLTLTHLGDVVFVPAGVEFSRSASYGNVNSRSLKEILADIRQDSLFQAYKAGGSGFLYYLAQRLKPDFRVFGKTRYDVLERISRNKTIQQAIREEIEKPGDFVDSYFQYVNSLDLRERNRV